nr:hypothetical protein [Tanacetum cinerariifolium]
MHESSKTRLLMTTEKSDSRKDITTLMLGEFRIQQVGISLSSTIRFRRCIATNYYGVISMSETFMPLTI